LSPAAQLVLIDTSAWIEALRPDGHPGVRARVDEALADGSVATCGPIMAELLVGARSDRELVVLRESMEALHVLPAEPEWPRCAKLGYDLRRKGMVVPTFDLLVACVAISGKCLLLHADKHFEAIASVSPLTQMNARG
jgi:predicted nucleic acid-binding protein